MTRGDYMLELLTQPEHAKGQSWWPAHMKALGSPSGAERPVVDMLRGFLEYADVHFRRYESGIGEDGVLGDHWEALGYSIIGLLNGECGRLDCGTVDSLIRQSMKAEGFAGEK